MNGGTNELFAVSWVGMLMGKEEKGREKGYVHIYISRRDEMGGVEKGMRMR